MASTVAIATRRRSPIESWWGARGPRRLHAHRAQGLGHPLGHLVARKPHVERAEGHVLLDRGHEQLVVGVLEHEAHPQAQLGQGVRPHLETGHLERSGSRHQPVQVKHQRGLAGAVGAQHGHALAMHHVQLDAAEPGLAVGVAVGEPRGMYRAAHASAPAATRSGTMARSTSTTKIASARRSTSGVSCGIWPR